MPSANAPSSSAGATATDFRNPSTSVNHSRTNRMSRSSSVRSTNSCCLSKPAISAGQGLRAPLDDTVCSTQPATTMGPPCCRHASRDPRRRAAGRRHGPRAAGQPPARAPPQFSAEARNVPPYGRSPQDIPGFCSGSCTSASGLTLTGAVPAPRGASSVLGGADWRTCSAEYAEAHDPAATRAGSGRPDGRRPRGQRGPGRRAGAYGCRSRGAICCCSPRCSSPATRSRTWRCGRRSSPRPGPMAIDVAATLVAEVLGDLPVVVGFLDQVEGAPTSPGTPRHSPQNAVAVLHQGAVVARYAKHHLPNYGVFDEFRYFVPGRDVRRGAHPWRRRRARHLRGPVAGRRTGRGVRAFAAPGLLLVPNGSPYERNKDDVRLELVPASRRGGRLHAGLSQHGRRAGRAGLRRRLARRRRRWRSPRSGAAVRRGAARRGPRCPVVRPQLDRRSGDLRRIRSPDYEPAPAADEPASSRTRRGLRGTRPGPARLRPQERFHVRRVRALRRDRLGAGRRRSRCDALGAENVYAVSMPSQYSCGHSLADAAELARRTGLHYRIVPIEPMVSHVRRRRWG